MPKLSRNSGFTLVELAVAIIVFAVGISGIAKMQTVAVGGNSYSMQLSDAVNFAQSQIETMLNDTYNNVQTSGAPLVQTSQTGINFSTSWAVSLQTDRSGREYKDVDLTVSWPTGERTASILINFAKIQDPF